MLNLNKLLRPFLFLNLSLLFVLPFGCVHVNAQNASNIGSWDLLVNMDEMQAPPSLEEKLSVVKTLVGYFVADGGSAKLISKVSFSNGKISFTIPTQWEESERDMVFETKLKDHKFARTIINDQMMPGITSGGLDNKEGEPRPIILQENHGPLQYRNIILTPVK